MALSLHRTLAGAQRPYNATRVAMLLDYARFAAFQFIMATLASSAAFTALCVGYFVKSTLGIDIMDGHFFLHDLFYR